MTTQELNGMDMDALLSGSIDDIVDLPGFETPPVGQYCLTVSFQQKVVQEKKQIEAQYELVDTLELKNPEEQPPVPGTKFSQLFDPTNIYALDNFKKTAGPIYVALGCATWGEFFEQTAQPVNIVATVKRRKDKNDPEKFYPDVKNVIVE